MCNKSIICGVLFSSGAITFYEGNNMLSALTKYAINRLIHGLRADIKGNMKKAVYQSISIFKLVSCFIFTSS